MKPPQIAQIPVALQDVLLPDELQGVMDVVREDNVDFDTVLLRSVRAYIATRKRQKDAETAAA